MNAVDEISATTDVELSTVELVKVPPEHDEYRPLAMPLREENERLRRGLLGQKAERLPRNDAQLSLALLEMAFARKPTSGAPEKKQKAGAHERRAARK